MDPKDIIDLAEGQFQQAAQQSSEVQDKLLTLLDEAEKSEKSIAEQEQNFRNELTKLQQELEDLDKQILEEQNEQKKLRNIIRIKTQEKEKNP